MHEQHRLLCEASPRLDQRSRQRSEELIAERGVRGGYLISFECVRSEERAHEPTDSLRDFRADFRPSRD